MPSARWLDGPVEPAQPPMTFWQMTKYLSVSMGLPGPTILFHQPVRPVSGLAPLGWWSPVSAWQINMAFDLSSYSVP